MVRFGEIAEFLLSGRRVTKTISATAGNVTTRLSPGSGKRWIILRGFITLTTDATVATRTLKFNVDDGSNATEYLGQAAGQDASLTKTTSLGEVKLYDGASKLSDNYIGLDPILLEGSDRLNIWITNGQAGDSYSGRIVLLEVDV